MLGEEPNEKKKRGHSEGETPGHRVSLAAPRFPAERGKKTFFLAFLCRWWRKRDEESKPRVPHASTDRREALEAVDLIICERPSKF